MTVPFSRPGAVDLSGLAKPQQQPGVRPSTGPAAGGSAGGSGAYVVDITAENFQTEVQRSATVPVVLCFYSAQSPESLELTATLGRLADEFEGRFLLAQVDVDANPQVAQAVGAPGVPLVAVALGGQLAPIAQQNVPEDELRQVLQQVGQTAVANGMTGRVEPRVVEQPEQPDTEDVSDPKYAEAEDAVAAGDIEAAVAAYQRLLDADPADAEARRGLNAAKLMQRTQDADLAAARAAAADNPADVPAQTLVADLDLLGGHVEDAFDRLVQTVARTAGDDRAAARTHLVELFDLVGNDDPRVLTFRTRLANALF
ncbi:MAG TPA: tetratricopeptide repeat protein [Nocardioidaceae bacterium]|nr:tetratricopeptide repeat protein [Nocardioidaceae bacterium]